MQFQNVFSMVGVDPILSLLVVLSIGIIFISFVFKLLNQPYVIAYIIVGVIMGPFCLKVITDDVLIANLGSFGLVLLLFYIGMEISISKLIENWRIPVIGTIIQIFLSLGIVLLIGWALKWSLNHSIILGFVISLSSSAIVISYLKNKNETNSRLGQNIIGILLIQDILVVPMLILLNFISGDNVSGISILKQIIGGIVLIGLMFWIIRKNFISLPFGNYIRKDHEIQVFIAFAFCFGFSILTTFFGLSSALGAFIAGMIVSKSKETIWVKRSMQPFRIVFVALFFVSIGMLVDLNFLYDNIGVVSVMVVLAFITNNFINALIVKFLGESWKDSLYTGAILAQIGEFSFILGATALFHHMISEHTYQLIISTISMTLIISPFWVIFISKAINYKKLKRIPQLPG